METFHPNDTRFEDSSQEKHFSQRHQISQHIPDKELPINQNRRYERLDIEQKWNGNNPNWNTLLHKSVSMEGYAL